MSRRRRTRTNFFAKRSPKDWFARIALALGLFVAGYFGVKESVANVLVKVNPAQAHLVAPANGVITAADAETVFTAHPVVDERALSIRLARQALRDDPTAVKALNVLGLQAQLRNDTARADRIFSFSTQLSRREIRAQIWAIEDAVSRGDIVGALRHYDIALRTSPDVQAMLFPTLNAALVEPRIRAELLRIFKTKPIWEKNFIAYVAPSGIDPEATMRLFAEGRRSGLIVPEKQRADLINALYNSGKVDLAWDTYKQLRRGVVRNRSRDPHFTVSADSPTIFDWRTGQDPGLSAAIFKSNKGVGLLDFDVPPSNSGVLVRQTELLPAGVYRLEGQSKGIDQPARSQPYWVLTCQDGRELGRVPVPNSAQNGGRFKGSFTVSQNCPIQTLSLVAISSDDISGVSGQIVRAQLVPET